MPGHNLLGRMHHMLESIVPAQTIERDTLNLRSRVRLVQLVWEN